MRITDINCCAALVCSIRRRSTKFRKALRNQYLAIQKVVIFCSGFCLATNSPTTESYLLGNTDANTKFSYFFVHIGRIYVFIPLLLSTIWLNIISISKSNQLYKQGSSTKKKRRKSGENETTANCLYGKPIWYTEAVRQFRQLRRDSHEKAVLSKRTQNSDVLPRIASGK